MTIKKILSKEIGVAEAAALRLSSTSQSSGRRIRFRHFSSFNVGRSVSANFLKVVLLNNIVANCAYDKS